MEQHEDRLVPRHTIQLFGREFSYRQEIPVQKVVQFLSRVSFDESGCWVWLAGCSRGYGAFSWNNRTVPAHRFAWIMFNGPIEPGNQIHHVCCNPSCVNVEHLQSLTPAAHLLEFTPGNIVYQQARLEVCHKGHLLSGDNLRQWINPKTGHKHRRCRACLRQWAAERYHKIHHQGEKQERTHCTNGHALTPENTYEWCGEKSCKTCHNAYSAKSYAKRHPPKPPKPPKTHCVNGHPWIEENLYRTGKEGKKVVVCYVCHKEGQRKSYEKRKARFGKFWNKPVNAL